MQQSNLTISTQLRLAHVIQSISQNELLAEKKRIQLAEQTLFQVETAYQRIDQVRLGAIALTDLVEFLEDNRISNSQVEAAYLFKRIDQDRDGRISLGDFTKYVLPRGSLRSVVLARAPYSIEQGMLLPNEVESALADLFAQELSNYRLINIPRQSLVNSLDYSSLEAFRTLDLFNQGYIQIDSLSLFMRNQGVPLLNDELQAFFNAVDLDLDGRISYSELVEAVHLMEPLPYKSELANQLRESEIRLAIEQNRSLERLYLPSYPYYFYPYYPHYYPYYYPSLRLENLKERERSLDRLRRSRLSQIETESKIRTLENEQRRNEERQRSAERLRQIQEESRIRELQIQEQNRIRELEIIRDNELRRSREIIRQAENEARFKQIELENRTREIERESRFQQLERQSRLLQAEQDLTNSQIRLRSLERLNSIDRLRQLESIRLEEQLRASQIRNSTYYSNLPYYNQVAAKYPLSILDSVNAFNTIRRYSPTNRSLAQSTIYQSPLKGRKQEYKPK